MAFNLNNILASNDDAKRTEWNYTIIAEDKGSTGIVKAVLAKREDGKEVPFTLTRIKELVSAQKLTISKDGTSFTLKIDANFDPKSRWSDLG